MLVTSLAAAAGPAEREDRFGWAVKALRSKVTVAWAGALTGAEARASAPAARAGAEAVSASRGTDAVCGAAPPAASRTAAPAGSPTPATRPDETATTIPV